MNIDHLRLFVRIARVNNISQAGSELGVSPAVASAYINKLEDHIGARLIHRTTRHVSLTQEGKTFLPHAEDVLNSVEAATASVGAGHQSPSGTLRITAPASFGRMHLMPAMKGFMQRYPDLHIECCLSDRIVDLIEGGFDIAIRNAELKSSSLIARKLACDRRILCAAPEYLHQAGEPNSPQELNQHQCLILSGLEQWRFETAEGTTTIKPQGKFKSDNGEAVRDACVQGLGIAINSSWSAYQCLQQGSLVQILQEYPIVSDTAIWAVYPSSRQLASKVRVFIDYLVEVYGDEPYWDSVVEG